MPITTVQTDEETKPAAPPPEAIEEPAEAAEDPKIQATPDGTISDI